MGRPKGTTNNLQKEREQIRKKIFPQIQKMVKEHGFDAVQYAFRRWLENSSKRAQLLHEKTDLEKRLKEIGFKLS